MNPQTHFTKYLYLVSLAFAVGLAGCTGMPFAFTPESAAQQAVLNRPMPEFTVDPASVHVLQTASLAEKRIVMVSFQGNRVNSGRESCLFTYETFRSQFGGWQTGGGGGGCGSAPIDNTQAISISSGKNGGGGPADIGFSEADGEVYDDKVTTVQITWSDGAVQPVSVINRSYLAIRAGIFDLSKVEALDADQNVIFSNDFGPVPGKP